MSLPKFLTPDALAERWHIEVATLANQRHRGIGLPYLKTPSGKVLYRLADVEEAERAGLYGWARDTVLSAIEAAPGLSSAQRREIAAHLEKSVRQALGARSPALPAT